jgi:hypothetical protein
VFIEVHRQEAAGPDLMNLAVMKLSRKHLLEKINTLLLIEAVNSATGLPANISK